jgi:hypothetical protein
VKRLNNRCDIQGLLSNYRLQHNVKKSIEKCLQTIEKKMERKAAAVCSTPRTIFHWYLFYICGVTNNGW